MMKTKTEMPPAVLRVSDPMPTQIAPSTVRKSALPTTARRACGDPSPASMPCEAKIACEPKKATNEATSISTKVTPAKTPSFAQRTGRRFGTAITVEPIMPVVYSPLITRTPSTPIASWARFTPPR